MDYEDALKFFDRYGNVADVERLRNQRPTHKQLDTAVAYSVDIHKQDHNIALAAKYAIIGYWSDK